MKAKTKLVFSAAIITAEIKERIKNQRLPHNRAAMKIPPLKKIVSCKFCLDYKGDPKPIFPEDMKHARKHYRTWHYFESPQFMPH